MRIVVAGERGYAFADPVEIIEANAPASVVQAFMRMEDALDNGYWIAGCLMYEAGFAFVDLPFDPKGSPLLCIGVFEGPSPPPAESYEAPLLGPLVARVPYPEYEAAIEAIRSAIRDGNVYQINYTVPFVVSYEGDPWGLFCALRRRAGVNHAAYVECGDRAILSLSPEMFLRIDGRQLWTKPMKGTAKPLDHVDLSSEKNRAEHVMIVDLLRNDLHRVCDEVTVEELFTQEHYPTFSTMTSTIRGDLRSGTTLHEVFAAMFPCGSITGAPKRSAVKYIAALERDARGIAMGSIGYLAPPRRGVWNIAIRTLELANGHGEIRIGGGIVADSCPVNEWAEILTKRRLFDELVEPFHIFETLRVEEGRCPLLDRHLERLNASAAALGFHCDTSAIRTSIDATLGTHVDSDPVLLRVQLDRTGVSTRLRPLDAVPTCACLCVSPIRIRSDDPALRYKTSRRSMHDQAQSYASSVGCFEALLMNERNELTEGSRSTLFVRQGGTLVTPPLDAGVLAGILRAKLLESGEATEGYVELQDLERADAVFVGSAARGLVPVTYRSISRLGEDR